MKEKKTASSKSDYIFRYKLNEIGDQREERFCTSRSELLKNQIENILNMVILCNGSTELKIDGFKLLNDRDYIQKLFDSPETFNSKINEPDTLFPSLALHKKETEGYDPEGERGDASQYSLQHLKNAAFYEPTIEYIKRQLDSILRLIDLEYKGEVVSVDGFRLKDLSQWVEESCCDPADMLGYLATRCNCNCVFCYNKGYPSSLALVSPSRFPKEEFEEIKTRLRYFSPKRGTNLFTSLGACKEPFIHPYFKEVLEGIRKRTDRLIRVATNGSTLTKETIDFLSRYKPLHLDVALHSSSTVLRQRLMGDKNPEIAINSLPLLRKAGIVFDIVIVPWPLITEEEMLEDMEKTIAYANENSVRLIQISLPGYTKYFSNKELFKHDLTWKAITEKIRDVRSKYEAPIVIRPAVYEENLFLDPKNKAEVIGIVKGSPAAYSGLEMGDLITKIGSNLIRNRPQARGLLSILQRSEINTVIIEVLRNGENKELSLDLKSFIYPYSKGADTHLGIVFMGTGLKTGYLESLREIIRNKKAKRVLLLTSVLIRPLLEQNLRESPFFGDEDLHIDIGVPSNAFFGGNICMGDLLVVQDYIDYIKDYIKSNDIYPDLVVIPSSPFNLNGWGRDLTGRVYLDIERETGIPTEILGCNTIYD
ncbi:MAG: radical SAM protein [Thermodesulfobacteriota bacterium]|nr:radical SAM protein [Thermodesulfobacteriota bacterium]